VTTNLVVGGFDLLAINLFEFGAEWRFAFAKNRDLPRSTFRKYTKGLSVLLRQFPYERVSVAGVN
jgi:hypothetical protein